MSTKDRMLAEMRREFKKIHSARKQRVPTKIKIASSPNKPSIFKNSSEGATVRRAENGNDDSQDYCKKIYRLKNQL